MSSIELTTLKDPLTLDELGKLDAYWRAANYVSVGRFTSMRIRCCVNR